MRRRKKSQQDGLKFKREEVFFFLSHPSSAGKIRLCWLGTHFGVGGDWELELVQRREGGLKVADVDEDDEIGFGDERILDSCGLGLGPVGEEGRKRGEERRRGEEEHELV